MRARCGWQCSVLKCKCAGMGTGGGHRGHVRGHRTITAKGGPAEPQAPGCQGHTTRPRPRAKTSRYAKQARARAHRGNRIPREGPCCYACQGERATGARPFRPPAAHTHTPHGWTYLRCQHKSPGIPGQHGAVIGGLDPCFGLRDGGGCAGGPHPGRRRRGPLCNQQGDRGGVRNLPARHGAGDGLDHVVGEGNTPFFTHALETLHETVTKCA